VTDLARLPRLSPAGRRRLEDVLRRRADGFLLEGRKAIADALARGDVAVREVWIVEGGDPAAASDLAEAAAARRVPVGIASERDLGALSETVTPQGALALVADAARPAADLLATARGPVLLLDRVQDPGNVGAILRVAAAFRAGGVLVGEGTADPLGPKALRASAGTALLVPFARGGTQDLLRAAAAAGYATWLLEGGGADLFALRERPARLLLAVGSEGSGASEAVASAATARIGIPIAPEVESLNAAVAAAVAAAHLSRLPVARGGAAR
jgi:RNA methyltransferase, TrmH family